MPSIHLAMATIFALTAFRIRRWLGWIFSGYILVMQVGSVILAWHYAVDGYIGIILACVLWYAANRFVDKNAYMLDLGTNPFRMQ